MEGRAFRPISPLLPPPLDPPLEGFAPTRRHHSYLTLSVTCLVRGRKALVLCEGARSLAELLGALL
eukprot:9469978-Pyramimonas_sp.AAC.1